MWFDTTPELVILFFYGVFKDMFSNKIILMLGFSAA